MNNSTAALDYMRKVRTVFCPDFLTERSRVFGFVIAGDLLFENGYKKTVDFSQIATSQRSDFLYLITGVTTYRFLIALCA